MNMIGRHSSRFLRQLLLCFSCVALIVPCLQSAAAEMNDYCNRPPFISEIITPNLLLMLDNSASMYDLAYPDRGRKVCSSAASTYCSADSDCPGGGTCSLFTRQPFYCYDQSYRSSASYIGYFQRVDDNGSPVYYSYDFTGQQFVPSGYGCRYTGAGSSTRYEIANQLCVIIDDSANSIAAFNASGNYLNWLTASKFDVEKQVLTGGKYVGGQLIAESRGCVGEAFIKEANTSDFVEYNRAAGTSDSSVNLNTSLGLTFAVRGPFDPYNDSGPSPGGQTFIEIYKGNYNQSSCEDAVKAITSGSNADVKQEVASCLAYSGGGTQSVAVKTKVSFALSMQACWQLRNGGDINRDDINTVKNQCTDIYSAYATCSNDPRKSCAVDADCGTGNSCTYGPSAIAPGNPALLCSNTYEGQYYEYRNNTWSLKTSATLDAMIETHRQFCRDLFTPPVIDPTDAPSNTAMYDNLPPIISSTGVIAQLGAPKGSLRVAVQRGSTPTGLLQKFDGRIRMGAMAFNFMGSASEAGVSATTVPVAKVCSVTTSKSCVSYLDCPSGETCMAAAAGTSNKDGAAVIAHVGKGHCASATATACATNEHCPSDDYCVSDGAGGHGRNCSITTAVSCSSNAGCPSGEACVSGLVNAVDNLTATSWTPLSEAFYNAIGYFAQRPADPRYSRTAMRLNSSDFMDNLNPSQFRCQGNNVLMVTDGMSTADRNSTVTDLAALYSSAFRAASPDSGTGWIGTDCAGGSGTCPSFGGSLNIDLMAWLAQNRKISTMNLSGTASSAPAAALSNRDKITTWVIFNGSDNGLTGDYNTVNLMKKTAVNGGSPGAFIAENPLAFEKALNDAFDSIAAGSASGTAASILSNSEGTSAVILQALFFPKKIFENNVSAHWIGELHNFWYYVDPFIGNSTIREDTDYSETGGHTLDLLRDKVANFYFDTNTNQTMVHLYTDTDGNGSGDIFDRDVTTDAVKSIWKAGKLLWSRNLTADPRTIYTQLGSASDIPVSGGNLKLFATTAKSDLAAYLDLASEAIPTASDLAAAEKIISYVSGNEVNGFRNRTVSIGRTSGVWRLGDIVSSTPRIQSTLPANNYHLSAPSGYADKSYNSYVTSNQYKNRGMAYTGANDGMLHAFKLGKLSVATSGTVKGTLSGENLGHEEWAFIPKNALPYLKYLADPDYNHLYYVDATPTIFDASIGRVVDVSTNDVCSTAHYWECPKNARVVDDGNNLDSVRNPWRSVIIGGMGAGGATRAHNASCSPGDSPPSYCVRTPRSDPADPGKELGYSSYFALDVTDPAAPKFLWEFNDPALGFATSGPAIIRVSEPNVTCLNQGPDANFPHCDGVHRNGRWFAVFASGPTGYIDTGRHQMLGRSDQSLKLFVVDIATGALVRTIDTRIENAFGGSLHGAAIDTDRWDQNSNGFYKDDVLYLGYVQRSGSGTWNAGGVIRLLTNESVDPAAWSVSTVINGIGPVSVAISRLQDRKNRNLWLYWGTGRYFYKSDVTATLDDCASQRAIYAVKEPCYSSQNDLNQACTTSVSVSSLTDQSTSAADALDTGRTNGWRILLDEQTSNTCDNNVCSVTRDYCDRTADCLNFCAERIITNPIALSTGTIFYTSFAPTADICSYGGNTYLWAIKYDTGYRTSAGSAYGKAVIQMSTGTFVEKNFTDASNPVFTARENRRTTVPMSGKPPADPPLLLNRGENKPVKKVIHLQER